MDCEVMVKLPKKWSRGVDSTAVCKHIMGRLGLDRVKLGVCRVVRVETDRSLDIRP